ncbi:iap [Clostera anastomosis granulovirus A]|uniref:Iap n=1 Tax=Clostera anastomosis granulovirus A TaxID=1986289 RepID=U5KBV3_9BBAC|nr:iap [Clostera anastomosis granulovirus Henan]AGQ20359.1 iap [Clostera anastomosis granulovirus Henan]
MKLNLIDLVRRRYAKNKRYVSIVQTMLLARFHASRDTILDKFVCEYYSAQTMYTKTVKLISDVFDVVIDEKRVNDVLCESFYKNDTITNIVMMVQLDNHMVTASPQTVRLCSFIVGECKICAECHLMLTGIKTAADIVNECEVLPEHSYMFCCNYVCDYCFTNKMYIKLCNEVLYSQPNLSTLKYLMDLYENRLMSLEQWSGHEDHEDLALVGFYYTGYSDVIACHYCKFNSYNYTTGEEDTLRDHKRYSPDCPFYKHHNDNYVNTRFLSPHVFTSSFTPPLPHRGDYSLSEHRINSFINFPNVLRSLVPKLCDAGFYYTNVGDVVCCYACSVIAKDFDLNSNVWQVHKRLNDQCSLLHLHTHGNDTTRWKDTTRSSDVGGTSIPSAPPYEDLHYTIPKCIKCKERSINAVLVPCFHFCVCQQCALTCTECAACDVYTGGFFVVNIPTDKLNLVEDEHSNVGRIRRA